MQIILSKKHMKLFTDLKKTRLRIENYLVELLSVIIIKTSNTRDNE